MYSDLIECFIKCTITCDACIKNATNDDSELTKLIERCSDCMFICGIMCNRLKNHKIFSDTFVKCIKLCIHVCKKCKNECLRFEDFLGLYVDCIESCRRCIIECNNIIYKNKND